MPVEISSGLCASLLINAALSAEERAAEQPSFKIMELYTQTQKLKLSRKYFFLRDSVILSLDNGHARRVCREGTPRESQCTGLQ